MMYMMMGVYSMLFTVHNGKFELGQKIADRRALLQGFLP